MNLYKKLFSARSFQQGTPNQLLPVQPEVMLKYLQSLKDVHWGRYAFSREPLEGKFTSEQKDALTHSAVQCGRVWATWVVKKYKTANPWQIAQAMNIHVECSSQTVGGGELLFAQFVQPNEITIFTNCLNNLQSLETILPNRDTLKNILLAHELFHAIEEQNKCNIFTHTLKIELWRKPFSNRSRIVCLSEIAAMAFAQELLGLSFNPYLLDVFLVYSYDQTAANELYSEICDLVKDVNKC